jgi:hypothetical protein
VSPPARRFAGIAHQLVAGGADLLHDLVLDRLRVGADVVLDRFADRRTRQVLQAVAEARPGSFHFGLERREVFVILPVGHAWIPSGMSQAARLEGT